MSAEDRSERLTEKLTTWAFVAAFLTVLGATAAWAGFLWKWPRCISGSCFFLAGFFALVNVLRREEWEPAPLRIRHWLLRIPGALVAFVLMAYGTFHWTPPFRVWDLQVGREW